jgi:nucleotide-binding universal stress UspA family protein/anti-anti-sigma regulatory factor
MIIEARDDVVHLEGRLDKNLWPTIQAAASLLLRNHVRGIIIDGTKITGCSPEGARTFSDALEYISRYHARFVVAGLCEEMVQAVRQVPGIRSQLPIAESVEDARKSLHFEGTRRAAPQAPARRALSDILVPLIGDVSPDLATLLARHLANAEGNKVRIHLVSVLEVPRVLPLNAPLPDEEEAASLLMEGALAIMRKEGVTAVTHVTRARDAGDEIVNQARELNANMIVLAYAPMADVVDETGARVIGTLMSHAPCEVVINRAAVAN